MISSSTSNHSPCGKKFREDGAWTSLGEARNSKTTTVTGLTNGRTPLMETTEIDSGQEYL